MRFEHELALPDGDLRHCRGLFVRHLPELEERFADLTITLVVKNSRNTLLVTCVETVLEVSLDTISYQLGERSSGDYEVEIELKSDSSHITNLRGFGSVIEEVFPQLQLTQQSRYERGVRIVVATAAHRE